MSQDHITSNITIGGDSSGSIAVGKDISQRHIAAPVPTPTAEDWQLLDMEFTGVRQQLEALAPEKARSARQRLDELQEAVAAERPDLSTMEYAHGWFARNLPQLADAVSALIAHPSVKVVVAAAGDAVAAEFRRRFPPSPPS